MSLIAHLLDSLEEDPSDVAPVNNTTLHRQATVATRWLMEQYLFSWLELLEGAIKCEYPHALANRVRLQVLANLRRDLQPEDTGKCVFVLAGIETHLRAMLRDLHVAPDERSMQWGIWARDVPVSIAYGFQDSGFLDDTVPKQIAVCSMLCAFLMSLLVEDDGVEQEIASRMFDEKPRVLLDLLRAIPDAPEA